MDTALLHFFEEQIEPIFDAPPQVEKSPPCPVAFVWRGLRWQIHTMLAEWRDYNRRGRMAQNMRPSHASAAARKGSWGVGRFYFRVLVETGQVFDIYYDRAPTNSDDRKGAWFLARELAPDKL